MAARQPAPGRSRSAVAGAVGAAGEDRPRPGHRRLARRPRACRRAQTVAVARHRARMGRRARGGAARAAERARTGAAGRRRGVGRRRRAAAAAHRRLCIGDRRVTRRNPKARFAAGQGAAVEAAAAGRLLADGLHGVRCRPDLASALADRDALGDRRSLRHAGRDISSRRRASRSSRPTASCTACWRASASSTSSRTLIVTATAAAAAAREARDAVDEELKVEAADAGTPRAWPLLRSSGACTISNSSSCS